MNREERIEIMRQRLQENFSPTHLEIKDDSDDHIGHAGAQGGAGHYTIVIASEKLQKLSRVNAHREIYHALNDLMMTDIHALKIKII